MLAPVGCLQYYNGASGLVQSFNYMQAGTCCQKCGGILISCCYSCQIFVKFGFIYCNFWITSFWQLLTLSAGHRHASQPGGRQPPGQPQLRGLRAHGVRLLRDQVKVMIMIVMMIVIVMMTLQVVPVPQ